MWYISLVKLVTREGKKSVVHGLTLLGPPPPRTSGGRPQSGIKVVQHKVKPGGSGDREKGSPSFTGLERGDRSDRALVFTLGPLCAHCCPGTFAGILSPPQKFAAINFHSSLSIIGVTFCCSCSVNWSLNKLVKLIKVSSFGSSCNHTGLIMSVCWSVPCVDLPNLNL